VGFFALDPTLLETRVPTAVLSEKNVCAWRALEALDIRVYDLAAEQVEVEVVFVVA
jgi:hypothetical protein